MFFYLEIYPSHSYKEKHLMLRLLERDSSFSAAPRCILVPFERYDRPKNAPKKVLVTLFPYIFHVKTK